MDMRLKDIDPEIHRAFKMSCIAAGVTMTEQVESMMLDFVKRQGAVQVPQVRQRAKK